MAIAASCLRSAAKGLGNHGDEELDEDEAEVGWLLAAEFLHAIRWTLQKK
ncbi:MAG: hypothetical protein U0269_13710 [Polyangiales bacterium]